MLVHQEAGDYDKRRRSAIGALVRTMSHNSGHVSEPDALASAAARLIDAGRFCYANGWVPATSGNLSARLDDGRIAVTVSGVHKGRLTASDIMVVDADGKPLEQGKRPSAETLLHTLVYERFPAAKAVLHTHSVNATLLSRHLSGELRLEDYELLKAFEGVDTHSTILTVPIFPNDQNIPRLAAKVVDYMDSHPKVHGFLIGGHGLYTWGSSVDNALRHLEAFEFLFQCEIHQHQFSRK